MWIENLNINNCRLLENTKIDFSPQFNLIVGENASGKSSLLESINILSKGRSFRTSHISQVITQGKASLLVSARINTGESRFQIGIEKSTTKTKIRINKKDIYSQAELSSHLPITTIHPGSIDLITGPPSCRRSYIDWVAFYLFPDFHLKWKHFQHILKQRNLCLRFPKHQYALSKWTEELVSLQPDITSYRKKVISILNPKLTQIAKVLLGSCEVDLQFKTGFPVDIEIEKDSLLKFYKSKEKNDLYLKRTSVGVHRADVKILLDSEVAAETASRGQLKLLTISLLLAQNATLTNTASEKGVLIIDDLAAELDKKNKDILLGFLSTLKQQIIITTTKSFNLSEMEHKVFHVKHGELEEA